MAALIPELQVKAEGRYARERMLVAIRVTFSGGDLEHGQAIKAGTHEFKVQAQQNQEQRRAEGAQRSFAETTGTVGSSPLPFEMAK